MAPAVGPRQPSAVIHLAFLELERAVEAEFIRWYEGEHVPRMLARPGWRRMACYRCTDGYPLLSLYDLDSDVPRAPPVSEAPFRSGPFAARGIRTYHARTWREIHAAGSPSWAAQWINAITVDVDPAHAEDFSRWYNEIHVPEILACPGWVANRRYECIDGEPRFLAIYDLKDPKSPFASCKWRSAVGWDEHREHIRGYHGFRVYERIFDSEDR
ncbi:MAG TPA: hypothetical protein VNL92_06030 [Dehalococcoidia bacterium]|jgi:hypothetical protein|nr:hypothetical protein [Dehalococcoidia bacterium]